MASGKKKRGEVAEAADLDRRQAAILRSVVRSHILSGEPVGSRTVSHGARLDLSPASIRNIMADLEERGLLTQPHTSAGRIPTDRAYRIYVDSMMPRPRMSGARAQEIDRALEDRRSEIPDLLGEASRQLSRFSSNVGVVLGPEFRRIVMERMEFVRLDSRRVVAILVGRSGFVLNRILDSAEPTDQADLDRVGAYLSETFSGRTLPDIRESLRRRLTEERAAYDRWTARVFDLGRRSLESDGGETEVFVEGASKLLGSPEFADPERGRAMLAALEHRRNLVDLLGRVLEGEGVQLIIGEENPTSELRQCSVVASAYGDGDRVMGTLGIVGPTRMEYAQAVVLVDHLARVLTRLFSGEQN